MDEHDRDRLYLLLLALMAECQEEIRARTTQLQNGIIARELWTGEMLHLLARYGGAALMLGVERDELTDAEQATLAAWLRGQAGYLADFANEIAHAAAWENYWNSRAEMYGDAVQVPYWMGYDHGVTLPAYPGDGSAECLTSDRCQWRLDWLDETRGDLNAYWVTEKDGKVCPTCQVRGERWFPLQVRGGVYHV